MTFTKKTIEEVDLEGKTVLMRADYNVPLSENSDATFKKSGGAPKSFGPQITDDLRIRASLPTIERIFAAGAKKVVIMSHLGRPKGQIVPELSLRPAAERLEELLLDHTVKFVPEIVGDKVKTAAAELKDGEILVLENLRFDPREEQNDAGFAREIIDAIQPDIFVQDGFAVVHRAHASTVAITELVPAIAGLLLAKEATELSKLFNPKKPFVLILGGAKVDDKAPLIEKFGAFTDRILVGGKIAADGFEPEPSLAKKVYVAEDFVADLTGAKLDCGERATLKMIQICQTAQTILWNGTLGKVEEPEFARASTALGLALGNMPTKTVVICGGDTTGFVENLCRAHRRLRYSLVSTGGGAALEFLTGAELPGIAALEDKTAPAVEPTNTPTDTPADAPE